MYSSEMIVKKSRFIACLYEITSEAEVNKHLQEQKQIHKKARHITYAYVLQKNGSELAGFSDDGEPKSTAGRPMYEILKLKNLSNYLVIVIRYFGGTKLGASGLTRAYRQAANLVLNEYLKEKHD